MSITISDKNIDFSLKSISEDLTKKSKFKKTKMDSLRFLIDNYYKEPKK